MIVTLSLLVLFGEVELNSPLLEPDLTVVTSLVNGMYWSAIMLGLLGLGQKSVAASS